MQKIIFYVKDFVFYYYIYLKILKLLLKLFYTIIDLYERFDSKEIKFLVKHS